MIVVAGAAVVCIGAIAVFGGSKNQETTPSVDVVTVKTGDVSQEVDASGTVESNEIKTYFSPVNAKIDKMDFETGDSVKKGEQLITYNVEDLEKEEKKEDLNLRSGELNYENTMNKSNKAANKQAAAAASVDELQAMVDSQEAYVYDLKQQLAEVQMQSQLDAQAQAEQAQADAQAQAQEAAKQAAAAYQEQMEKYNQELEKAQKAFDQAKEKELACLTAKKNAQLAYDQNQDPAKEQQLSNALVNATYDYEAAKVEKENAQDTLQEVKANVPSASDGTSGMEDLNGSTGDVSSVTVDTSDLELAIEQASSDLAELQSEGQRFFFIQEYPEFLSLGDTGVLVEQLQYMLSVLSSFLPQVPDPGMSGIFDNATLNAVRGFQRYAGLPVTGSVGEATWDAIFEQFNSVDITVFDNGALFPGTEDFAESTRLTQFPGQTMAINDRDGGTV